MCNKTLIYIYCLLLVPLLLYSQEENIRFDKISTAQGFTQSTITTIFQDTQGFLWFGTYDGLKRYDGYGSKTFKHIPGDSTSLAQNLIEDICQDSKGFLWIATENGLSKFNPDGESFTNYYSDPHDEKTLSSNFLINIIEDHEGYLWLTTNSGVNRYERKKDSFLRFYHNPNDDNSLSDNFVLTVFEDSKNNLWFGTENGLDLYDRKGNKFCHFKHDPHDSYSLSNNVVMDIIEDRSGALWVGTRNGGLNRMKSDHKTFHRYIFDPGNPYSLRNNMIVDQLIDDSGNLWVATHGGLEKYDSTHDGFIHYVKDLKNPGSLSSSTINSLLQDNSGILWIGTVFGGVNKYDKSTGQFHHYKQNPYESFSLGDDNVNVIFEDTSENKDRFFLGTREGISVMDYNSRKFYNYSHQPANPNSLSGSIVNTIMKDEFGKLWIGTSHGINKWDYQTQKFTHYFHDNNKPGSLSNNQIRYIYEDSDGKLWFATNGNGVDLYDRKNDKFINYHRNTDEKQGLNDIIVWCIVQDNNELLWFGTNSGGLNVLNKTTQKFTYYVNNPDDTTSISNNKVLCCFKTEDGTLWFGTAGGGLNKYDRDINGFIHYTENDGLVSNTVHAIVGDNLNNLWITSNRGLSKFDLKTEKFSNFNVQDGLQSDEFHVNSAIKSASGDILLGGINGFNIFNPQKIKSSDFVPPIVFTDFQLFNKSVPVGKTEDGRVILRKTISKTDEIVLSYKDEVFSIEFAALDYRAPGRNLYSYKMGGFDKDWNYSGNRHFVTYTKLPAGDYTFYVKGSNSSGVWNENTNSLRIIITPPIWEMWWFRILAFLIFIGILVLIYRVRLSSIQKGKKLLEQYNAQLSQEIKERKETEKELTEARDVAERANKLKSEFLAQISHEIRSPINITSSYLGLIKEEIEDKDSSIMSTCLKAIESANSRVIRTIDLILNVSEIQLGLYQPSIKIIDLKKDVLDEIILQYSSKAKEKKLKLMFLCDALDTKIYGDRYSITQIMANLVDNAIKYTENGSIEIRILNDESGNLEVTISDTGIGISEEYLPSLFEEFSQEEQGYTRRFEGNGLGLALVKKYCELNNAEIFVDSKKDEGTRFKVVFPARNFNSE